MKQPSLSPFRMNFDFNNVRRQVDFVSVGKYILLSTLRLQVQRPFLGPPPVPPFQLNDLVQ